jgi:hypothetical protein
MHVLESYALNSNSKIDKPYVYEKYFPLAVENYITIDGDNRTQSKCYDYWQEVVDIVHNILKENGISIVQVGSKDDKHLANCYLTNGQATFNQLPYIIKNSLAHVSIDNYTAELASSYGRKQVCICSNNYPENSKPYWTNWERMTLLEPERGGEKPSFSSFENEKTINKIFPHVIANKIFEILNIGRVFGYEYVKIGEDYNEGHLGIIPDDTIDKYPIQHPPSIRMDLYFNEESLAKNLSMSKLPIITNKPIDITLLQNFRPNIIEVVYVIEKDNSPQFVKMLSKLGIRFALTSYLPEDELNQFKIDYMDHSLIIPQRRGKKEEVDGVNGDLFYKSNKFLLSRGKIYPSESAWKHDLPVKSLQREVLPVIDENEFWDDIKNFCIMKGT